MKTREKDVLLICKDWYDKKRDNYADNPIIDALLDYQSIKTISKKEYLTASDISVFCLLPAAKAFFNTHEWVELIQDRMIKRASIEAYRGKITEVNQEYVNQLFISELNSLQVKKNQNDEWIIDLSDYDNINHDEDWWLSN